MPNSSITSYVRRRSGRSAIVLASFILFLFILLRRQHELEPPQIPALGGANREILHDTVVPHAPVKAPSRVTMVIASLKKENTTWFEELMPEWDKKIYVTDDPDARYSVPVNKGREGMVYLT